MRRPEDVSHTFIEAYLATLTARGLAPASVNRALYALRGLFKWLRRERIIPEDPTEGVAAQRDERPEPKFLTVAEQDTVLTTLATDATPTGIRDCAVVAMLLGAGVRVTELGLLQLGHVDLEGARGAGGAGQGRPVASRAVARAGDTATAPLPRAAAPTPPGPTRPRTSSSRCGW